MRYNGFLGHPQNSFLKHSLFSAHCSNRDNNFLHKTACTQQGCCIISSFRSLATNLLLHLMVVRWEIAYCIGGIVYRSRTSYRTQYSVSDPVSYTVPYLTVLLVTASFRNLQIKSGITGSLYFFAMAAQFAGEGRHTSIISCAAPAFLWRCLPVAHFSESRLALAPSQILEKRLWPTTTPHSIPCDKTCMNCTRTIL